MQMLQARRVERAEEMHGLGVEGEYRGKVLRRRIADQSQGSVAGGA